MPGKPHIDHQAVTLTDVRRLLKVEAEGNLRLECRHPGKYRRVNLAKNLKRLFEAADLPYMSPYKFRHGHAVYGLKRAQDVSDFKAVRMNLMHSSLGVTDSVCAVLSNQDVQKRIANLGKGISHTSTSSDDLVQLLKRALAEVEA